MPGVEISLVSSRSDMKEFIDLPWRIYAGDDKWVPPLKRHVRGLLDDKTHPFWKFSSRALFLARRGGRVVGRIAGIIDGHNNEYHREKAGAWGFFECEDDREAAHELFRSVGDWASAGGMSFLRGPMNPSTNYEVGLLVEGFEYPPIIMMPYNPRYYLSLVESYGFEKEKDLLSLLMDRADRSSERIERLVERIKRNTDVRIRNGDKSDFDSEMRLIAEIYSSAWADNWGFVPMSEEEMREAGKNLVRLLDEELCFFIYHGDDAAGVVMILPDISPLLKRFNGKIGLRGLYHLLFHRNEIKGYRGMLFGVKKRYQKLGLPLVAFDHADRVLRGRKDCEYMEFCWTLEDNTAINKLVMEFGAKIHKRHRVYRKPLE